LAQKIVVRPHEGPPNRAFNLGGRFVRVTAGDDLSADSTCVLSVFPRRLPDGMSPHTAGSLRMSWKSLRRLLKPSARRVRTPCRPQGWPTLEYLEDRLVPAGPPVITTNPVSLTVDAGHVATFTAAATATPAAHVQWKFSTDGGAHFKNIAFATTDTLRFTATAGLDGDEFEAVFTNSLGSATTTAATLTVHFAPEITTQPDSKIVAVGGQATLTAHAKADPAATVQWQVSTDKGKTFTDITGNASATTDTLTFTAPATEGTTLYRAVFTNSLGHATTRVVSVTTEIPPTVTTNPTSVTIDAGHVATFTAAATADPAAHVQWMVSTDGGAHFKNIVGATSDTLRVLATAERDGNEYEAVFTNGAGSATTTAATLTVHFAPEITLQPVSKVVATGSQVTLTAHASADPAATVQWQVSTDKGKTFTDITGNASATTDTLTFTAPATVGTTLYRAVFTNSLGHVTTRVVSVTADVAPDVTTNPADVTVHAGQVATFTAAATADPKATVQWKVSTDGGAHFKNIAGATSTTLHVLASAAKNGDLYEAVFTNPAGSATSTAAKLTVA
jgi:hypothetical protein